MDTKSLTDFIVYTRIVSYVQAGSIAILVFDSFLTFDQEIEAIWAKKWNSIRVLYVLTRYSAFLEAGVIIYRFTIPGELYTTCLLVYRLGTVILAFGLGVGEVIMTIRTWAAWNRNRYLTYVLPIFYGSVWIGSFAMVFIFLRTVRFDPSPLASYAGCHLTRSDPIIFVSWVLLLLYDTVMLILMAIPAWSVYRLRGRPRLIEVVHRDGVLYYLYLFVLSLANIIISLTVPTNLMSVVTLLSRMIHAILACRVVLHIHECRHSRPRLPTITVPDS